jgi:protein-S-isoprenylcysteine O-methyltransferase Ste14
MSADPLKFFILTIIVSFLSFSGYIGLRTVDNMKLCLTEDNSRTTKAKEWITPIAIMAIHILVTFIIGMYSKFQIQQWAVVTGVSSILIGIGVFLYIIWSKRFCIDNVTSVFEHSGVITGIQSGVLLGVLWSIKWSKSS